MPVNELSLSLPRCQSRPHPLSRCWSRRGDRVPSCSPAQDSKEPLASLPSTRSGWCSLPGRRHHTKGGAPRATQPHQRLPREDSEEPGALAAGLGLGMGCAGTARGHQRLDGTGEMEGVHQAASLGKHGMGSRQVLFVTRLRGLRAINTVGFFFKGSELAIGNACCLGDLEVFF